MQMYKQNHVMIDSGGMIYIKRRNAYVDMTCPYKSAPCNHTCPLLAELYDDEEGNAHIRFCNGYTLRIADDKRE